MNKSDFDNKIRHLVAMGYNHHVVKEAPYDPEDGGIPPEMLDGDANEDGWGRWKQVPSRVSDSAIDQLFREYNVQAPVSLKEYLKADCHLIDQINNGEFMVMLPFIPSDNPLGPMKKELKAWEPLLSLGYIPISQMEDGWGPICYEVESESVVWFDHEELFRVDIQELENEIKKLRKPLFDCLDSFYKAVLKPLD